MAIIGIFVSGTS